MKTAVIEIGSYILLCPSVAAAAKLMELLGKTIRVRRQYQKSGQETYTPERNDGEEYSFPVEMRLIEQSQIKVAPKRLPEERRLGYTPTISEGGQ